MLRGHQIRSDRFRVWPPTGRSCRFGRELSAGLVPAAATTAGHDMIHHHSGRHGDVDHLADRPADHRRIDETVAAGPALGGPVKDRAVRDPTAQRRTRRPGLFARGPAWAVTITSSLAGLAFPSTTNPAIHPITRRR